MNLFYIVIIIDLTLIITLLLIFSTLDRPETAEREETQEEKKYLTLQNMTTAEILTFKTKKDFYKTITDYDTIKYFLKYDEDKNNDLLINWYYPGYKKL